MHRNYNAYRDYVLQGTADEWDFEVSSAKRDLLNDMSLSPDFHPDTLRNGSPQPLLLTRGGEQHTYNVVCRPGDDLYAGDVIDAFGHKWLVMEARADATTHKTGVMRQCNKLFRFQNFSSEVIERCGIIDVSGYSSSFNNNTQMQHSSEQVAIYLPYDEATAQIYVDKRLPSHVGVDKFGSPILYSFKVMGVDPVSRSCNDGDHLLMLKAERFLYSEVNDNIDLEICDYISNTNEQSINGESQTNYTCEITGSTTIRIGCTRIYKARFFDENGSEVSDMHCAWNVLGNGTSFIETSDGIKVSVIDDTALIGDEINIRAESDDMSFSPAEFKVEVISVV